MSAIQIRDVVHGTIDVSADERAILSHPLVARLRGVRQLGFVEQVFPGATHTRYAHALGVMHVAARILDGVLPNGFIPAADRDRMRRTIRMVALLHDLGHPPFSHSLEAELPRFRNDDGDRGARHEAFTRHLIESSDLGTVLEHAGVDVADVLGVLDHRGSFVCAGVDYGPLLGAIVAGELDADRMDYLLRDSHHAGVSYGRYDYEWIVRNLAMTIVDGRARLAISRRGLYAFDDFLFSRLQMFLAVYFHPTPVALDEMLRRHFASGCATFHLPTDAVAFTTCDDGALIENLRASREPWARRIVDRRPFKLLFETDDNPTAAEQLAAILDEAGVPRFTTTSLGVVSEYFGGDPPLLVVGAKNEIRPISDVASLLKNHSRPVEIARVYVAPEAWDAAAELRNRAFS